MKAYLVKNYFGYIQRFNGSQKVREILLDLGRLFALDQILSGMVYFLKVRS